MASQSLNEFRLLAGLQSPLSEIREERAAQKAAPHITENARDPNEVAQRVVDKALGASALAHSPGPAAGARRRHEVADQLAARAEAYFLAKGKPDEAFPMHVLSKVHQHILRPRYPVSPEEAEVLSRRAVKRSQKVASLPPDTHPEKRARHDYHAAGAHAEAKNAHMMLGNMEGARRHYKQEVAHENAYNTTPFSSDEEIPES